VLTRSYGFSIFGDLYLGPQASPEKRVGRSGIYGRVGPFDSARRDESNGMGLVSKPYHWDTILYPFM